MKSRRLHAWNLTPKEAIALQKRFAARINATKSLGQFDLIAGADISHNRFSHDIVAGVVVWRASDNCIVEKRAVHGKTEFPYVPGLLSFREAPLVLAAFAKIRTKLDAVMIDGQGIAHPRRLGLASHIGLWLGVPTIGCAKSRLCGDFKAPARRAGSSTRLTLEGKVVGRVLRSKNAAKPLFISPGHRIDVSGAVQVVVACLRGYRMPEPTRLAHLYVNEERRKRLG